jgi:hypothetical protein
MFEKIVYVNVGADKASVKQNSNGVWICNELTINDKHLDDCLTGIDKSIGRMNEILNSYNKHLDVEVKKEKK